MAENKLEFRIHQFTAGTPGAGSMAKTNCTFVAPGDFTRICAVTGEDPGKAARFGTPCVVRGMVFNVKPSKEAAQQENGTLWTNKFQRRSANLVNKSLHVLKPYAVRDTLYKLGLRVGYVTKSEDTRRRELECEQLQQKIVRSFKNQVFTEGQSFYLSYKFEDKKCNVKLTVEDIELLDADAATDGKFQPKMVSGLKQGQLTDQTTFTFKKAAEVKIVLLQPETDECRMIIPKGGFKEMGIGGLDRQFKDIFIRAFVSRIVSPAFLRKLKMKPIKGILLYGPPGCGKTLIARTLAKKMNAKEPKIVAGPSILNKFVGESERAIRDLFADAEKEQMERGDQSDLHVIIFDEIDAICKKRGSDRSGAGVHDSLVNQLLSKIDGVDELNNILLIAMTNRKDMLDDALLRAGRLEEHIEIGLPDEKGRNQILAIHTAGFVANDKMGANVSVPALAARTKNFTGAELASLCVRASQNMLARMVDMTTYQIDPAALRRAKITAGDFNKALEGMKPMFAPKDDEMAKNYPGGVVFFNDEMEHICSRLTTCADQLRSSRRTRNLPVLLHGCSKSGKSALSAWAAVHSRFPYIRRISADMPGIIGSTNAAKVSTIDGVFQDAYKTPLSCIVIDDLERLIEYVRVGNAVQFNQAVLNALLVLVPKSPPDTERGLMVICTSSNARLVREIGFGDIFVQVMELPLLGGGDAATIEKFLSETTKIKAQVVREIAARVAKEGLSIPVKKMNFVVEFARQETGEYNREDGDTTAADELIESRAFYEILVSQMAGVSFSAGLGRSERHRSEPPAHLFEPTNSTAAPRAAAGAAAGLPPGSLGAAATDAFSEALDAAGDGDLGMGAWQ